MAINQPQGTDPLNIPDHALSHRVFANDDSAPVQSIVVSSTGAVTIADLDTVGYVKTDSSGNLSVGNPTETDEKVKYDASDPTAGYVADKVVAGAGISVAEGTGATENKLVITNSNPTPYSLPTASVSVLGGVKVGSGLAIDGGGVLSATSGGAGYISEPFTSQTTIVLAHNLGAYPVIQVMDDTGAVVIPLSITNTSVDSATIIFSSSTSGTIVATLGASPFSVSVAFRSKSFTITNPTAGATYAIWKAPTGVTITSIDAVQIGGTNVIGILTECDANGLNPVVVDATDMTITTSNTSKTSFSNPSIDSGDWIGWKNTSVSGAVSRLMVTFNYE